MKNVKKKRLVDELDELRRKVADLEVSEIELKKANDALSIVFDAVDSTVAGIIITNNDGLVTYANPSFLLMFHYTEKNEIIGAKAVDLFQEGEIDKLSDIQGIIDSSIGQTEEFTVQNKSGNYFFVEVSSSSVTNSQGNVVGRMVSFVDITRRKQLEQEKDSLIQKLQNALDNIKILRGLIPICSKCKKIRDDKGYWNHLERYIESHSDAFFSHSLCPECTEVLYGNEDWYKKKWDSEK